MLDTQFEIAIVGAGMAGLTCAQMLHQAGYKVVVMDKSRGLGGRMATRRLQGTHADHGVCYLKPKSSEFQNLLDRLVDRKISRIWTDTIHQFADDQIQAQSNANCYAAANGISAIAKFLSIGLTLRLNHCVERIEANHGWQLHCESGEIISAQAVIVAIPAPQAAALCESIDPELLDRIQAVKYSACLSAIAVYPAETPLPDWKALICADPEVGWIGIDSTKQLNPAQPAVVVQSTAQFAEAHLEEVDLQQAGERLLARSSEIAAPWLSNPEAFQVHRWRYAFPIEPLSEKYLIANANLPLIFTGDWCWGSRVESAFQAGLATAAQLNQTLSDRALPHSFWANI